MEEPRRKWRISVRAALLLVLGLCVSFALIRAAFISSNHFVAVAGVVLVGGTLGALVGILTGREPMEGFAWGLVFVIALGAIALLGLPMIQY